MWKAAYYAGLCGLVSAVQAFAAEDVKVETILSDLKAPTTIAFRPDDTAQDFQWFIAEGGAGRVVRVASGSPSEIVEVIGGFPGAAGSNLELPGNPRGLFFIARERLVVLSGSDSVEARLYELNDDLKDVNADAAKQTVQLKEPAGDNSEQSTATSIARTRANDAVTDRLLVASGGALGQIPLRAGTLGDPTTVHDATDDAESIHPAAVAVSDQGYAVIAEAASRSNDPAITFLNPTTGQKALRVGIDLREIRGFAYGPESGQLYAIGRSSSERTSEGVFRINDEPNASGRVARAVKIADVSQPTSLAFGPDGALYVTSVKGSDNGSLIKISGKL